ncbi:conserved Plasmodium protein, unknown function [Plasmodium chabaudi chabaudi]|uniref:Protein GPR89, putative n=1 Tax=Plasmodium chabaudi chabaudi TaxID=31271 RepID=A0A077TR14_PLACU|nr:protein GPR89, putative [Plasmodium chabaudi chabaudi]SCM24348.1 conserved Plasmodium protein, unknown function [Plasmodium chabaudi chabaudi]SCN61797.1 conserved Plasmodium protein, unknown function [Plasmodium chabaudi chabaudi]VTZ69545.1 protein GPR89, putative [Plasmodium chabaudi chabaudi]|eukprot:XP_732188.2 conserved Plasmodium protein, unknown function [Plasmodium chabaudi chabaudi]
MYTKFVCEVIAIIFLHGIFYKVSAHYLLRYLDILNYSNQFNKNIFFITFLACMSIFSLFILELSNLISSVMITYIWHINICILMCLLYIVIPIEFINTIFDSRNYKEILSPGFYSHSHIKLIKKYYIKISQIYKEKNGGSTKIKKYFFIFRSIIFLSFLWLGLVELKKMIYKKNYNYVIADDNALIFREYILYTKINQNKNRIKEFNKRMFYLYIQNKNKCIDYDNINQKYEYKENKKTKIQNIFYQLYNFINILIFIILNHFMYFYQFVIRELLINLCALGVTTNSIVAGISSMYFIYDYIITFVYYLNLPKIQIQIYNIEERILINFTKYIFKKEQLQKIESKFNIKNSINNNSTNFNGDPKNDLNFLSTRTSIFPLGLLNKNKKSFNSDKEHNRIERHRKTINIPYILNDVSFMDKSNINMTAFNFKKRNTKNSTSIDKNINDINYKKNSIDTVHSKTSFTTNGPNEYCNNNSNNNQEDNTRRFSSFAGFKSKLKSICTFKSKGLFDYEKDMQYNYSDLNMDLLNNNINANEYEELNLRSLKKHKLRKSNGNLSDHESTAINYFYKNINENNDYVLKRSNSSPYILTKTNLNINSDREKDSSSDEEQILITCKSLTTIPKRDADDLEDKQNDENSVMTNDKTDNNDASDTNSKTDTNCVDKKTKKETPDANQIFKSVSFPENQHMKKFYNKTNREQIEGLKHLYKLKKPKMDIDNENKTRSYKMDGMHHAYPDIDNYSNTNTDKDISYNNTNDVDNNIESYNKLKKEIENIVYTNTSMYYSLNDILSRKIEIQKNTNSLFGKINVFLNSIMFLTLIYKIIASILNIIFIRIYIRDPFSKLIEKICLFFKIKYNIAIIYAPYISLIYISYIVAINMKKFLQQVIQISTNFSFYFKLFSNMWILLISELMGLYFVTNSLILASYLPVNYEHTMNFAAGDNYDYNVFHIHSDYVFISSFATTFTFFVLHMLYFYFF